MHILVVNDDGPPSNQSSPYIHSLIQTLQESSHTVSVILPHQQRSWIGKAHFVSQITKPTYFRPGTLHEDDGTVHTSPLPPSDSSDQEEWILVDGTPATCTQLGLHHFFQDKGPVDIVLSGPNYGRNCTSLFSLSSGTIGGAMEAAICRKKAIALSYAFYSRDHDPNLIAQASRLSVKLIEHLYKNWGQDVDLYSINVPLIDGVESHKVMCTHALQNYWKSGSSFTEVEATEEEEANPNEREQEIRQSGEAGSAPQKPATRHQHRHFKWTPQFGDILQSVEESEPGNDGWALKEGYTSVTPLKANFMLASGVQMGEMKLSQPSPSPPPPPHLHIALSTTPYLHPLILCALHTHLPPFSYTLLPLPRLTTSTPFPPLPTTDPLSLAPLLPTPHTPILQLLPYESLDFAHLLAHPRTSFAHSYIIRKALIRKHYLWETVRHFAVKDPVLGGELRRHVPETVGFEVDYAEFLEEALVEAWELRGSLEGNVGGGEGEEKEREWWVLKPGMSDKGDGVRLFWSEEGLRGIFEGWEGDEEEEKEEEDNDNDPNLTPWSPQTKPTNQPTGIITSHLRHFIAQRYIARPLLFPTLGNRKFHLRSYVLAVGALRVYVFREMLALFAAKPYRAPGNDNDAEPDLGAHLTNTCLQDGDDDNAETSIIPFRDLPPSLPFDGTLAQISHLTSLLFRAATATQSLHFQPLPNAFEVFGVDWLVDEDRKVWLLEANAFPDFGASGDKGRGVVGRFWEGVVGVLVGGEGFLGGLGGGVGGVGGREEGVGEEGVGEEGVGEEGVGEEREREEEGKAENGMVKVLDIDLGRR